MRLSLAVAIRLFALAVFTLTGSGTAWSDALDKAYQREIDVLKREKNALQKAITRDRQAAQAARRALSREIETLASGLARQESENATFGESMQAREQRQRALSGRRSLDDVHHQIETWLRSRGMTVQHGRSGPQALPELITLAWQAIASRGALRLRDGQEVFDAGGSAIKRQVLRLAEVGAVIWRVDEGQVSPLIPTAEGTLRTVAGLSGTRRDVRGGHLVDAVLYDPQRPPTAAAYTRGGFLQWMAVGGPLMWPLLLMALVAAGVGMVRLAVLLREASRWRRLWRRLTGPIAEHEWAEAATRAERQASLFARAAAQILGRPNAARAVLEERLTEALLAVRPRLFRYLSLLSVTAGAAPLVGLLGTVTGMIRTFSVITEHGTGDPRLLSGGISEALLTTQLGLAVAIPALLLRTALARWATRRFEAAEVVLLDLVHHVEDARLGVDHFHPVTSAGGES